MREVVVVAPDRGWREAFEAEAARLRSILGEHLLQIHHIGSTAIPSIAAKPIIDILPVMRDIECVDALHEALASAGYGPGASSACPADATSPGKRTASARTMFMSMRSATRRSRATSLSGTT